MPPACSRDLCITQCLEPGCGEQTPLVVTFLSLVISKCMGKRLGDDLAKTTVTILSVIILSASTVFGAKSASSWSVSGHGENLLPGKSDKGRRRDLMADVYACEGCSLGGGGYPGVAGRTTGTTPAVRVLTLLERIPALDCEFKVRGQGTRPFGAEGTRSRRDAGWRGCASRGGQCCSPHKRVYNRALLCVYVFVRGPAAAALQPPQPAVVNRQRGPQDTPVLEPSGLSQAHFGGGHKPTGWI
jgi:hypothetical protein